MDIRWSCSLIGASGKARGCPLWDHRALPAYFLSAASLLKADSMAVAAAGCGAPLRPPP
jgi:hypothetical protein